MHALIIDNDTLIANSIELILRDYGFASCDFAQSSKDAFAAVARKRPDLIVSDVQLVPDNGLDTLLAICREGNIPKILITEAAGDVKGRLPKSLALEKPFAVATLTQAVALVMHEPGAIVVLTRDQAEDKGRSPTTLRAELRH